MISAKFQPKILKVVRYYFLAMRGNNRLEGLSPLDCFWLRPCFVLLYWDNFPRSSTFWSPYKLFGIMHHRHWTVFWTFSTLVVNSFSLRSLILLIPMRNFEKMVHGLNKEEYKEYRN